MATIKELKTQIENANALGIANLTEKGVEIPENATTYKIMQSIADVESGSGGVTYTDIVYNKDDTITLTDKDGNTHTMECEYVDEKLTGLKYDGKTVDLTYDGDWLIKVGKTNVNLNNLSLLLYKKFSVDYDEYPYIHISVVPDTSNWYTCYVYFISTYTQLEGNISITGFRHRQSIRFTTDEINNVNLLVNSVLNVNFRDKETATGSYSNDGYNYTNFDCVINTGVSHTIFE